jgi:5-(carboxyamino)imidazole ribonucleotide synthase
VIVGMLGGGQLGLMLADAALAMGHEPRCLDPKPDSCARRVCELIVAPFDDPAALDALARDVDLATYEFEQVPAAAVERLSASVPVRPGAESLRVAQDRLLEKRTLRRTRFETAAFEAVDGADDLAAALERLGRPSILKSRFGGYDGKGQVRVVDQAPEDAWAALGGVPAILEAHVPFDRELSLVCVRALGGDVAFFPVVENRHEHGILRVTRAPAPAVAPASEVALQHHARGLLGALDHVGVLTIELFDVGGRLLANEIAPRVHNSGHWTIEGAETSQFTAHLRAITGEPLGPTTLRSPAAMVNLIGEIPGALRTLDRPGLTLHDYGKAPRAGRKVGHATIVDDDPARLEATVAEVESLVRA